MNRDESADASVKMGRGTAPRRWQFSLRQLILLTALVAVYLAAISMVLPDDKGHVASYKLAYVAVMNAGVFVVFGSINLLFKRHYGRILVQLKSRQTARLYGPWALLPLSCLIVIPLLPVDLTNIAHNTALGGLVPNLVLSCWAVLDDRVQLRERGIIFGMWRRTWTQFPRVAWHIDDQGVLTLGKHRGARVQATVPPDQRAAVEALLEEKLG